MVELTHWVAHRGIPAHFPGNSKEGIQAVLESGARYVEFDIQLSADGVPVLCHDANLRQSTGVKAYVADLTWEELRVIGWRGGRGCIPSLQEVVVLLEGYPETIVFAEIKTGALQGGMERAVDAILAILEPIRSRCVPISFHAGVLRRIRAVGGWPVGWIFATWSLSNRRLAEKLCPEYLFANQARIPTGATLFFGPWRWVLYEISDRKLARHWLEQGASLLETNDLWRMVGSIKDVSDDDGSGRS